jgi:hypothetical protein
MARTGTAPLILILIAATADATGAARGEDCLAGPNAQSPQGRHWYYRVDRAAHRKCWYLGDLKRHRAAAVQTNTARRRVAPPPEPEAPAPPQVPARTEAPDPGFGTRWPDAVPAGAIAGPRADPERAVASATPVPAPLGARPVPTERVRNEPAPVKPPEPAKAQAAAPAAAASEARGLPAALFGVALLLAAVGTILVRARRRLVRVRDYAVAPVRAAAARDTAHARRRLREILAQAGHDETDRYQAHASRFFERVRRGLDESFAAAADAAPPDIAAATLQPAIDPFAPEARRSKSRGVEPAPDVEQSLRELLAAWERRAA